MPYAVRQIWIELLTALVLFSAAAWVLWDRHALGAFDGAAGIQAWARTVLVLIGAGIGVAIAVSIAFAIGHAVVTGTRGDDLVDERDRLIAGFGWKVSAVASSIGFIGALILLATGASVLHGLNVMLAAFALGDTAGNLAKLWRYHRGG